MLVSEHSGQARADRAWLLLCVTATEPLADHAIVRVRDMYVDACDVCTWLCPLVGHNFSRRHVARVCTPLGSLGAWGTRAARCAGASDSNVPMISFPLSNPSEPQPYCSLLRLTSCSDKHCVCMQLDCLRWEMWSGRNGQASRNDESHGVATHACAPDDRCLPADVMLA